MDTCYKNYSLEGGQVQGGVPLIVVGELEGGSTGVNDHLHEGNQAVLHQVPQRVLNTQPTNLSQLSLKTSTVKGNINPILFF